MAWRSDGDQWYNTRTYLKSPKEDNKAGELGKAEEVLGMVLPANQDPALPLDYPDWSQPGPIAPRWVMVLAGLIAAMNADAAYNTDAAYKHPTTGSCRRTS